MSSMRIHIFCRIHQTITVTKSESVALAANFKKNGKRIETNTSRVLVCVQRRWSCSLTAAKILTL